ncbi:MAG: RtcB family protein [Flavobacteriales bacterium]|nr:RtcB family protein [Flavobacteriales bacterium]
MSKSRIKGKDLKKINYQSDRAKSLAIAIMAKHYKHLSKAEKLKILEDVLLNPEDYLGHRFLAPVAEQFTAVVVKENYREYKLNESTGFRVFGKPFVDQNTLNQMDVASQLPIAVKAAIMPDAHVGYGLPIGGVLATDNAVIPYGVGLDIGCRMSLSIYDVKEDFLKRNQYLMKTALKECTHFGIGKMQDTIEEHEVLERSAFQELSLLRQLHGKAKGQLGTSGSGNHFVEFGIVELEVDNCLGVPKGQYLGLLAHSGSRGFGATIANYYTRVAIDTCRLPQGAKHLAWLDLNSEAGQEYWLSMNLAGDYAKACHDVIHRKIAKAIGLKAVAKVENHHNFAWKETQLDGQELIVHRKGATPAKLGQMGIIPATMLHPGYIVSGKGNEGSLNSASHGAGRKMSRKKAKETLTRSEMNKQLKAAGITLIGGGVDESPWAYKNIEDVMKSQKDLVKIEGMFYPKIVKMNK